MECTNSIHNLDAEEDSLLTANLSRIHKFTLSFKDKTIEKDYKETYFKKSLLVFRISFIAASIIYSVFGFFDSKTSLEFVKEFYIIRYLIVLPLLLGVFTFSFSKYFLKVWQYLLSLCFLISGSGIIYMLLKNPDNIYYYGGMLLIIIGGYFSIKLRFIAAVIPSVLLVVIYNVGAFLMEIFYHVEYEHMLITNALYISAIIISMIALYNLEFLERKDFYQRILLSQKQQEITCINLNLESKIQERTKLLDTRNKELLEEIKSRKIIEEKHIKSLERAKESDRLKSAFLANVSHEIRTPMNGILGFSELLKEPYLTNEKQLKYIGIIENSGNRLLGIINDLLDISKVESGLMEIFISETDINEQIEFIYSFFKPEIESKGMQFIINAQSELANVIIKTDRVKVNAILTNLVKNAIKYSDKGVIELGYELKGDFLEFCVKDSGIGIAKNNQEAIFNRFVQADMSSSRVCEGTGLGLSISKAYVEMLKGKIWVNSKLEKGSQFYFTIPLVLKTA